MPLDGSPKKLAQDIASGLFSLNRATMKRFTLPEIQKIEIGLQTVTKELRQETTESGDYAALKEKGMKMQRINGAMMAIRTYLKEHRSL